MSVLVPDPPAKMVSADAVNLRQAVKLAFSLVLFYAFALTVNWDVANYGSLAIVLVSLGTRGASLQKGIARVIGTTVGVAIGYCAIALFGQDRWGMAVVFAVYLTIVSYFMQGSRSGYAWFVVAFVPLVIWGDNYPSFSNTFYFGTFRWLETTVGIVIYTTIDLLLWPRHAGNQFRQQRIQLWSEVANLLGSYKQILSGELDQKEISGQREKTVSILDSARTSFDQARLDTPSVRANRAKWQAWMDGTTSHLAVLSLWYESIVDCKKYDLKDQVDSLRPVLEPLMRRIALIEELERQGTGAEPTKRPEVSDLLAELPLDSTSEQAMKSLTPIQRSMFQNFVDQLRSLDQSSREILRLLVSEEGAPPATQVDSSALRRPLTAADWPADRWLRATYPAVVFVAGFLLWILVNPPTGPKVPMMAGIFSLMVVLNRINPVPVLVLMIVSTLVAVAPVYWLIMPRLSTWESLLCLVFIYTFTFSYLGGKQPALKMGPMVMFVNMTGISNQQSYSFQGPVDGALMTLLAGTVASLVFVFYLPLRPEVGVVRGLRRFFHGCVKIVQAYRPPDEPKSNMAKPDSPAANVPIRHRYLESSLLPIPPKISLASKSIDPRTFDAALPQQLQHLSDSLKGLADRFYILEWQINSTRQAFADMNYRLIPIVGHLQRELQNQFLELASLPNSGRNISTSNTDDGRLLRELDGMLKTIDDDLANGRLDSKSVTAMCRLIDSLRGLVNSLNTTTKIMHAIDWKSFTASRF